MNRSRDPWSWAGIWAVGVTAVVWSFSSLSDLAALVGITGTIPLPLGITAHVSWGLPVTLDVLAVVATRVWLRNTAPADAVRYAQRAAWSAIACSIAGNAYHGLLSGDGRVDSLIVSAVPPCVIGVLVHLGMLVARPDRRDDNSAPQRTVADLAAERLTDAATVSDDVHTDSNTTDAPPTDSRPETFPPPPGGTPPHRTAALRSVPRIAHATVTPPDGLPTVAEARKLLEQGAGRPTLMRILRISDSHARTLKADPDALSTELLAEFQARHAANTRS